MKFTIESKALLKPLQMVVGAVEQRQTLPVLANVLLVIKSHQLSILSTDLEIELLARVTLPEPADPGEITIPARKLIDICRTLPDASVMEFQLKDQKVVIQAGKSRFMLATLPAEEFPNLEAGPGVTEFSVRQQDLRYLIEKVQFAMAQKDVRYYLNGLLLQVEPNIMRAVATDGHRLAMSALPLATGAPEQQVIIPRKGVNELFRLLEATEEAVTVCFNPNYVKITAKGFVFISKLIDGRFPDYQQVIPKEGRNKLKVDKDLIREALARAAILSNEKNHGAQLQLRNNNLRISTNNPEREEAEEELQVDYAGEDLDVGFNVNYLLDVFGILPTGEAQLSVNDSNSSALIESLVDDNNVYIVMPLKL